MEAKLTIAMLMARFHISVDPSSRGWKTPADVKSALRAQVTLRFPSNSLLTMRPRVPTA